MLEVWSDNYCEFERFKNTKYCDQSSNIKANVEDLRAMVMAIAATQQRVISKCLLYYLFVIVI